MLDVGAPELLVLIVIAIILFGPEKLPEFARKAARVVRYVRGIAGNAQSQLSKELGPGFEDVDIRDLNPKAFIQKHLLDDVDPIVADVKKEIGTVGALGGAAMGQLNDAVDDARNGSSSNGSSSNGSSADGSTNGSTNGSANEALNGYATYRELTPFDSDAT